MNLSLASTSRDNHALRNRSVRNSFTGNVLIGRSTTTTNSLENDAIESRHIEENSINKSNEFTRAYSQPKIIREWLNRADGQRGENDIIHFYSYLERAHHDLLEFAAIANRRQILKDMLHHFMES